MATVQPKKRVNSRLAFALAARTCPNITKACQRSAAFETYEGT